MRNQADSSEAVGYHVSLWTTSGWTDLWYTLVNTSQPWTPATSSPWTATTTTALLQVSISETLTTDHSILVDLIQVLVVPPVLGSVGISIGNPSSFEYPVLANTTAAQQSTNPGALLVLPTAAVPWYFPLGSRAGIATIGSFWDPLPGSAAPDGRQYMILQEYSLQPVNAWTYVLGLVKGSSYYFSFVIGLRNQYDAATFAYLTWTMSNVDGSAQTPIWNFTVVGTQNPYLPWQANFTGAFIATNASMILNISYNEGNGDDHTFCLDTITLVPGVPATGQAIGLQLGVKYSFEQPVLPNKTASYACTGYLTGWCAPNATLPWSFCPPVSAQGAGIAAVGSAFDPHSGFIADGVQYAYLQSTSNAVPYMNATLLGLTVGQSYYLNFLWAMRNQADNYENAYFGFTVNGLNVWYYEATSAQLAFIWYNSTAFVAPSGVITLVAYFFNPNGDDHTAVFDAITVMPSPAAALPAGLQVGTVSSFEYPTVTTLQLSSALTALLPSVATPWTLTGGAGIVSKGQGYDPDYQMFGDVDGNQFAVLTTNAAGAVNSVTASFQALTVGQLYFVKFTWGITNAVPETNEVITFTVTISGATVYSQLITIIEPWQAARTLSFTARLRTASRSRQWARRRTHTRSPSTRCA